MTEKEREEGEENEENAENDEGKVINLKVRGNRKTITEIMTEAKKHNLPTPIFLQHLINKGLTESKKLREAPMRTDKDTKDAIDTSKKSSDLIDEQVKNVSGSLDNLTGVAIKTTKTLQALENLKRAKEDSKDVLDLLFPKISENGDDTNSQDESKKTLVNLLRQHLHPQPTQPLFTPEEVRDLYRLKIQTSMLNSIIPNNSNNGTSGGYLDSLKELIILLPILKELKGDSKDGQNGIIEAIRLMKELEKGNDGNIDQISNLYNALIESNKNTQKDVIDMREKMEKERLEADRELNRQLLSTLMESNDKRAEEMERLIKEINKNREEGDEGEVSNALQTLQKNLSQFNETTQAIKQAQDTIQNIIPKKGHDGKKEGQGMIETIIGHIKDGVDKYCDLKRLELQQQSVSIPNKDNDINTPTIPPPRQQTQPEGQPGGQPAPLQQLNNLQQQQSNINIQPEDTGNTTKPSTKPFVLGAGETQKISVSVADVGNNKVTDNTTDTPKPETDL